VAVTCPSRVGTATICVPPKTVKLSTAIEIIAGAAVAAQASPTPIGSPMATPTPVADLSANTNKASDSSADTSSADTAYANAANVSGEVVAKTEENEGTSSDAASAASALSPRVYEGSLWAFIWLAVTLGAL